MVSPTDDRVTVSWLRPRGELPSRFWGLAVAMSRRLRAAGTWTSGQRAEGQPKRMINRAT